MIPFQLLKAWLKLKMVVFQFPIVKLPEGINFFSQRIMCHLPEDNVPLKIQSNPSSLGNKVFSTSNGRDIQVSTTF